MYFAILHSCNKTIPLVLAVCTNFMDIKQMISLKLGISIANFNKYIDSDNETESDDIDSDDIDIKNNNIPYSVIDIQHEHIISYEFTFAQLIKLDNKYCSYANSCKGFVSIFESDDNFIDCNHIINKIELI